MKLREATNLKERIDAQVLSWDWDDVGGLYITSSDGMDFEVAMLESGERWESFRTWQQWENYCTRYLVRLEDLKPREE